MQPKPVRSVLLLVLLLAGVAPALAEVVRNVRPGDVAQLRELIAEANASGEATRLTLAGEYRFGREDTLPLITGTLTLQGRDLLAAFSPADGGGPDQLLRIAREGSLALERIRFSDFRLSRIQAHDGPLIENRGSLTINRGQFSNHLGRFGGGFCCTEVQHELIGNWGTVLIERTAFFEVENAGFVGGILVNHGGDAELDTVLVAARHDASGAALANFGGGLRIIGSTFGARETAVVTRGGGVTELANTVVTEEALRRRFGDAGVACDGPVVSLGHNLVPDASCALDGPADLQGQATGMLPLVIEREFGLARPAIRPAAASPAIDSADQSYCGYHDLYGTTRGIDGDGDGEGRCDRGALEIFQRSLTSGGATGFYHVPDNDGHYLTILENANNTLVIWNTFDRQGNQAWIFGTGDLVGGRSLVVDAYRNLDGRMTRRGPVDVSLAEPWGTLTIELETCDQGQLAWDAAVPGFGAGSLTFRRLAAARQLGCAE